MEGLGPLPTIAAHFRERGRRKRASPTSREHAGRSRALSRSTTGWRSRSRLAAPAPPPPAAASSPHASVRAVAAARQRRGRVQPGPRPARVVRVSAVRSLRDLEGSSSYATWRLSPLCRPLPELRSRNPLSARSSSSSPPFRSRSSPASSVQTNALRLPRPTGAAVRTRAAAEIRRAT